MLYWTIDMKPYLYKEFSGDWRFYFPEEMVFVMDDYYESVEQIDHDEDLAQIGQWSNQSISRMSYWCLQSFEISNRNQSKTEQALQYAITVYMIGMVSFPTSFNHNHDNWYG